MPQHDYNLADANGLAFRADLNGALAAIVSQNSGATEPATPFAYQFWADTTSGKLKQRNAANSAWIEILDLATGEGIALKTHAAASKASPVDADELPIVDSAASNGLKKLTLANLKAIFVAMFAAKGANSDITSLAGLTTPLTSAQGGAQVQPITASVGSGTLTVSLNPTSLDFRSATLASGTVNRRAVPALISVVIPGGATLGAINAIQPRLVVLAIDNAGTIELAVVNLAGGNDLSETGLISTTAINAASDSANVFYSTTARSNVPYRVVGAVVVVNTAEAWDSPTLVQGYGGQALAAMSSLGYGQTWQDITGSRVLGTTYYNTTGKPILAYFYTSNTDVLAKSAIITVNGITQTGATAAGTVGFISAISTIIPAGASYTYTTSGGTATSTILELR